MGDWKGDKKKYLGVLFVETMVGFPIYGFAYVCFVLSCFWLYIGCELRWITLDLVVCSLCKICDVDI